jgi:Flp pilus assembly protein TadG
VSGVGLRDVRHERGSVLVEAAIVLPVVIYLLVGIADFGIGWQDRLTTETAVRGGARTAANLTDARLADYNVLQTVKAALADIPSGNIDWIVVFKANSAATPSAPCQTGTSQSGGTTPCNVYTSASLNLDQSAFTGTTSCTGSSPDRFWCPTGRVNEQATADYLGVWVQLHRARITPLIPGQTIIHATAVMRLEPPGI